MSLCCYTGTQELLNASHREGRRVDCHPVQKRGGVRVGRARNGTLIIKYILLEEAKVEKQENLVAVDKDEVRDFSNLETYLNLNHAKIRELIEMHVLENPEILSERLSIKF